MLFSEFDFLLLNSNRDFSSGGVPLLRFFSNTNALTVGRFDTKSLLFEIISFRITNSLVIFSEDIGLNPHIFLK